MLDTRAPVKLLRQFGIYATWLSSIAYLQKQLHIIIFNPTFLWLHKMSSMFLLKEAIEILPAYLFILNICLSRVSN